MSVGTEDRSLESYMAEIDTLRKRRHQYIIPIIFSFTTRFGSSSESNPSEKDVVIGFPPFEMDMKRWLPKAPVLIPDNQSSISIRRAYLYKSVQQILQGLAFLHRPCEGRTTSHHDLKPANILVDEEKMVIGDLGKAKLRSLMVGSGVTESRTLGTLEYSPPENFDADGKVARKGRDLSVRDRVVSPEEYGQRRRAGGSQLFFGVLHFGKT